LVVRRIQTLDAQKAQQVRPLLAQPFRQPPMVQVRQTPPLVDQRVQSLLDLGRVLGKSLL
jgi:hypothetical protein